MVSSKSKAGAVTAFMVEASTINSPWSAVNFTVVFLSCGFIALPSEPVTALDAHWPGTDNCWLLTVEAYDCFIVSAPTSAMAIQQYR